LKHSTPKLLRSYALLQARPTDLVAENPAEYEVQPSHTGEGDKPGETSSLPHGLVRRGQTLRLATALIEGASMASADRQANVDRLRVFSRVAVGSGVVTESNEESNEELIDRLGRLVRSSDRNMAEQLKLLARIDEMQLWKDPGQGGGGCRDCAQWMDRTLGISRITALERLRVARALESLSVIESLFALGKLSWSKVRELTRVADPACEQELAAAALELSAAETVELCQRWHHSDTDTGDPDDTEAARALQSFHNRSLTSRRRDAGTTRITLDLPHDRAAEFLKALEAQEDVLQAEFTAEELPAAAPGSGSTSELDTSPATARQRRADAALLMSARALAHLGEPVASADRYRVFVNIDARVLADDPMLDAGVRSATPPGELPPERPCIAGYGPIAAATARRLASQARLTVVSTDQEGEVVAKGRDTRLFSPSAIRAITARDRCCQMPGCTRNRWLQAHHVIPWSEGGETTIANGCLVCAGCHLQLHEGNLRLELVTRGSIALPEQEQLTMTTDEQSRARAAIAAVQRFRLVRRDGRYVAGPRRRGNSRDRPSQNLCGNEHSAGSYGNDTGSVTGDRTDSKEIDDLSLSVSCDRLEQYRVA